MFPPDRPERPLRTLIVEDEPLARIHLRDLVQGSMPLQLIGEASNGRDAVQSIARLQPDVLFLDIHLPELDGLAVLEQAAQPAHVVFTTAYDSYAVHAFELGAADYLVKPFTRERFERAVARLLTRVAQHGDSSADVGVPSESPAQMAGVRHLHDQASGDTQLRHVYVRERGRMLPVAVDTIERLEADDDYVVLVVAGRRHLLTVPLSELLGRLDSGRFVRIHRSHAVNLDHVRAMLPADAGRWAVVMQSGDRVLASRTGTRQLRESMGRSRG
jgi:two-component system LytT family response regulator